MLEVMIVEFNTVLQMCVQMFVIDPYQMIIMEIIQTQIIEI